MNSDDSLNSSQEQLIKDGAYRPPSLPGVIPLNHSYPEVLPEPQMRSQVYSPSYPVLQPMPVTVQESTKFEQDAQIQILKDQQIVDKKNLFRSINSVKIWTCILAVIVLISSIKLINVLGARPLVIALVLGKFAVVGLFFRHVRLARRAVRNGSTPMVKKMHKASIKSTILLILLVVGLAIFLGPKIGRKMHKALKR